ncbi:MAG: hypothetical protein EXS68_02365 [Candidatus Ryanbacteria bacterium]|nr:hypothetical protein [Candidatus Ryanbacteria bacterium]
MEVLFTLYTLGISIVALPIFFAVFIFLFIFSRKPFIDLLVGELAIVVSWGFLFNVSIIETWYSDQDLLPDIFYAWVGALSLTIIAEFAVYIILILFGLSIPNIKSVLLHTVLAGIAILFILLLPAHWTLLGAAGSFY